MTASKTRRRLLVAFAFTGLVSITLPATAQQPAPAPAPKEEEVPFWAIGKPKSGPGAAHGAGAAPSRSPTPADKLPIAKMKLPPGFKVEVYAADVLDARGLRQGDKGTIFVSSLFVAGKIYAIVDKGGKREVKTILEKLELPNGIEFHKGSLYVATPKDITRYDDIEAKLDKPARPGRRSTTDLPGDIPHGWKFIKFGPDGKLYVPVGAPCNICEPVLGQVRAHPPHQPRRQRHGDRGARRAQHGGLRLPSQDQASCGSPTTSATGCRRTCPTTS